MVPAHEDPPPYLSGYVLLTNQPRTVFIAGGSSGIGRGTAIAFAKRGWRVGLIARGAPGLEAAAADVRCAGMTCGTAVADVTDSDALRLAADRLVAKLGPPTVWINCAGNGVYGRFPVVPETEFDRVTAVTYGGTVNGCRVALNLMREKGHGTIVNVCSAVAFHGLPLMTSYAGAKSAVRGFAQALQAELTMERSAIRVSTVFPPAVNTPFFSHAPSHMGWPARPAQPVYQPEIVCEAIYIAAMTGQAELIVSGTVAVFSLVQPRVPETDRLPNAAPRFRWPTHARPGSGTGPAVDPVRALVQRVTCAWSVWASGARVQYPGLATPLFA